MTVELVENAEARTLEVSVSGKLSADDYETLEPGVDKLIESSGKIKILFIMHDFHGWDLGAVWEDIKFDFKHWRDIERLAIVGESKWEEGMATFCKPFTSAKIQYFDSSSIEEARRWVNE